MRILRKIPIYSNQLDYEILVNVNSHNEKMTLTRCDHVLLLLDQNYN